MAIITMTDAMAAQVAGMNWGQRRFDVTSRSPFGAQALEIGAPLWLADFSVIPVYEAGAGLWKTTLLKLQGQVNQFEMWDLRRPVPLGTMRGSMTLGSAAASGATALVISGGVGQAGKTLLEGDMLQLGSGETQQVVMVMDPATADGSGDIAVTIQPPLRNAFSLGETVVWERPKALFRRLESESSWEYAPLVTRGFALSFIEDWRA